MKSNVYYLFILLSNIDSGKTIENKIAKIRVEQDEHNLKEIILHTSTQYDSEISTYVWTGRRIWLLVDPPFHLVFFAALSLQE